MQKHLLLYVTIVLLGIAGISCDKESEKLNVGIQLQFPTPQLAVDTIVIRTWSDATNFDQIKVFPYNSQSGNLGELPEETPLTVAVYALHQGDTIYSGVQHSVMINDGVTTITVPLSITLPKTPTGLIGTIVNGKPKVTWNRVYVASSYEIHREVGNGTGFLMYKSGVLDTVYTDLTVIPGKTYRYKVVAVNQSGKSSFNNNVATVTMPKAPDTTPPVLIFTSHPTKIDTVPKNFLLTVWGTVVDTESGIKKLTIRQEPLVISKDGFWKKEAIRIISDTTFIFTAIDSADNQISDTIIIKVDVSSDIVLKENTTILDSTTLVNGVKSYDAKTGVIHLDTAIGKFKVGDIITSGISPKTPYGLLKKVTAVSNSNGVTSLTTTNSTIIDAIGKGKFNESISLKKSDIESIQLAPGVRVIENSRNFEWEFGLDFIFADTDGDTVNTKHDQLRTKGTISFGADLILDGEVDWLLRLVEAKVGAKISNSQKLNISGEVELAGFKKEIPVATLKTHPVYFLIAGTVPCVARMILPLKLHLDGSITAGIQYEISRVEEITAGVQYIQGDWKPLLEHKKQITPGEVSCFGSASLSATLSKELQALFYEAGGPTIAIGATLGAEATGKLTTDYLDVGLTLKFGVNGSVGGKINFIDNAEVNLDFPITPTYTIFEKSWKHSISAPLNLTGSPGDKNIVLTWDTVPNVNKYTLYWGNTPSITKQSNKITNVTPPFTHDNLVNDKMYYYAVASVIGGSDGKLSEVKGYKTNTNEQIKITFPISTTIWYEEQTQSYCTWNGSQADSIQFEIYKGDSLVGEYHGKTLNDGKVDRTSKLGKWGTGSNYRIRAIDTDGNFGWSEYFSINTNTKYSLKVEASKHVVDVRSLDQTSNLFTLPTNGSYNFAISGNALDNSNGGDDYFNGVVLFYSNTLDSDGNGKPYLVINKNSSHSVSDLYGPSGRCYFRMFFIEKDVASNNLGEFYVNITGDTTGVIKINAKSHSVDIRDFQSNIATIDIPAGQKYKITAIDGSPKNNNNGGDDKMAGVIVYYQDILESDGNRQVSTFLKPDGTLTTATLYGSSISKVWAFFLESDVSSNNSGYIQLNFEPQ